VTEDIVDRLARIETKIDTLIIGESDHETRIRAVERGQWKHTGSMLVLSPLLLYVANKLGFHIA
jgi:hypothetical protein